MPSQFEKLSEQYLRETDLTYRKTLGQYFTPRSIREELLAQLPVMHHPKILDPACGSGEFLLSAKEKYPDALLHGWEIDARLVAISRKIAGGAEVFELDALLQECSPGYDMVIGNPPYFEFKPEDATRNRFAVVISGRPNIFAMFIKLGLDLLVEGGYLAYVVPPSMNNGAYFKKLRDYVVARSNIEYMSILDSPQHFEGAIQSVMLLVLRKTANRGNYLFTRSGITIFSPEPENLTRAFRNKTTLHEAGYTVRTGQVVWNQHKDKLTDRPGGAVPLIRPADITPHGLQLEKLAGKPRYIRYRRYNVGPAIVVNRVTGSAGNARLKAAVVPRGTRFLGENHINVIFPPNGAAISATTLDRHLARICDALNSPETLANIRLITGNTQISRTELEHLLPIPKLA